MPHVQCERLNLTPLVDLVLPVLTTVPIQSWPPAQQVDWIGLERRRQHPCLRRSCPHLLIRSWCLQKRGPVTTRQGSQMLAIYRRKIKLRNKGERELGTRVWPHHLPNELFVHRCGFQKPAQLCMGCVRTYEPWTLESNWKVELGKSYSFSKYCGSQRVDENMQKRLRQISLTFTGTCLTPHGSQQMKSKTS